MIYNYNIQSHIIKFHVATNPFHIMKSLAQGMRGVLKHSICNDENITNYHLEMSVLHAIKFSIGLCLFMGLIKGGEVERSGKAQVIKRLSFSLQHEKSSTERR